MVSIALDNLGIPYTAGVGAGARTPNLPIHAELSNYLIYRARHIPSSVLEHWPIIMSGIMGQVYFRQLTW